MPGRLDDTETIHEDRLERDLQAMFAGASTPSIHAGPSRSDIGVPPPRPREFSDAHRPRVHKRRLKHRESEDSVRHDILRLLKDVEDRLAVELARAEEAESRAREADARAAALKVAQRTLEEKTRAAQESLLAYQAELRNARTQLEAGQSEIQRLEVERNDAEQTAARARTTARQATERLTSENAREEGRREGMEIGRQEGLRLARAQGWTTADESDDHPLEDVFRSTGVAPPVDAEFYSPTRARRPRPSVSIAVAPQVEADLTSPTRARRPRRQVSTSLDSTTRRRPRQRPSVAPMSEPPPAPGVPDFAPMADTIPRETMTTPLPRLPGVGIHSPTTPAPTPGSRMPQPSPHHPRARSSSIAGRNISAPIPIPGRPITPSPGPSNEPHQHAPVQALPDTYIPTFDEDSEVPFPLPPPHELSGIPATPSISSRAPLTAATAPVTGTGATGAGPAVATQAAKAVGRGINRGIRSIFKSAKRASTSAMSDLSLLRDPQQEGPPQPLPMDPTVDRRPALSVIIEDGGGSSSRGPSRSTIPPPRPIFPEPASPIAPQYTSSREPSASPTAESGLQSWNAEQSRRRMIASELREPDVGELDLRSPRRQAESVRSAATGTTSYYHRFNRTRPQMPKPLAPTGAVAHLQDQAERYDSNVSVTDSRAPSEGRFPYSNRTPAHSVSSIGRSSTRRKPPPGMPQPMISVQPPTRNNSYQHQPADAPSIIYSPPAQRRTPQPHPVSPTGPPTVSIISPVPQRPRSTSGPSITITAPEMRSAPSPRPLRRQASASSIGSATSSVHSKASKRSAYKRFDKHDYVDPAFMATNNPDQNPFTPGTPAAAMFNDLSRPPSPTGSHAARW